MTRSTLLLIWGICIMIPSYARLENDSILRVLEYELNRKTIYAAEKEEQIRNMKQLLHVPDLTLNQQYMLNRQLYVAYRAYQTDSALCYLQKNLIIANTMSNERYFHETQLDLSYMYWQSGKFFEAIQNLESLDRGRFNCLPEELLRSYYETFKLLYRYYSNAQTDEANVYYEYSYLYRDSLLQITPTDSKQYHVLTAEKLSDENKTQQATQILLGLLAESDNEDHERAIFANLIAGIYQKEGNLEMQKKYYAISAICDIKNAITENTSMQALALILFQEGDIDLAYKYIQSSIDDAIFCNARFRTYEISKIFPIIDAAYQAKSMKQKRELQLYLLLVSILLVFLIATIILVYRQMQKIAKIRGELVDANQKLKELNTDLQDSNIRLHELNNELILINRELSEINVIKEIYLGKFIDLCSIYIEKIDNYRRSLNRIIKSGKIEELRTVLKSTNYVESELADFYKNFDQTFLRIYPTFIEEFNALFPDGGLQKLKFGELLNTELRIYALIRLGINHSAKIALFLRLSTPTVSSYRSKLKHISLNLEENIMKIGR